jgi:hypothetical protein
MADTPPPPNSDRIRRLVAGFSENILALRERLERLVEAHEHRIDELVCRLYGLTDDEIKIVEEATPP